MLLCHQPAKACRACASVSFLLDTASASLCVIARRASTAATAARCATRALATILARYEFKSLLAAPAVMPLCRVATDFAADDCATSASNAPQYACMSLLAAPDESR